MHLDPALAPTVSVILIVLLIGIFMRLMKQPHVISYLLAGIIVGPFGLQLINDIDFINRLGSIGVILLLFFVGMETDAKKLISDWKIIIFGTAFQVLFSVLAVWIIGQWFDWSLSRIILIGFVISLSSTAVLIKLLQDSGELKSKIGQGVLGILLAQDLAIIPMILIIGMLNPSSEAVVHWQLQLLGAVLMAGLFIFIVFKKQIKLPFASWIKADHELQLFVALAICFGMALLTAAFELSTALGAFLGGLLIGSAKEAEWVTKTLESLKMLFLAFFFLSIGLLLNIDYFTTHIPQVVFLVLAALITNTLINAGILRVANFDWKQSLYAGALLSQIGEFSFVLAALGLQASIISDEGYQLALCVIALSLFLSPLWISGFRKMTRHSNK
ncbi:cation:proton antiporter [Shewanella sp. 202IG2-18]|uniref:cation:proton antiporter n=1 Tax=Parashewanella hymeniacidonis TaxID=2807618 RepID=UPI001961ADF0|nr:cation:proton antiporter [Parashewanella hymeniacidonis]MBM7072266.1 cation:proton antiporter [Parashewanella hymeniacidonis]